MSEVEEPQRVIMPFGKYKGEFLGDIPKHYLEWVIDNMDLGNPLRDSIERTVEML